MDTVTNPLSVENSTKFKISLETLETLNRMGMPGVKGTYPIIDSASGFLQRLAQKLEWRKKDGKRAKAYIRSLVKGSALLDSFVLVPADLILKSAEIEFEASVEEEKEAWKVVLKYIKTRIENGVEFFIIDGQNRLKESLIPFFTNKLPFDSLPLSFKDNKGNKFNCAGKFFKELSKDIQLYIKSIEIPLVVATSGDISEFSQALIWKNEGIAWDDWQKLIMNQWYTKFRRQISSIASQDEGDAPSRKALSMVSGQKYSYDVNGYDRLIAELLIWMNKQVMPTSISEFESFFNGTNTVTKTQVDLIKKYLRPFSIKYPDKSKISNTELRNYIMLRFVLDYPKKFKTLSVPNWRIEKPVDFVSWYKTITKVLMKDPEDYGELPPYQIVKHPDGSTSKSKTPGSYNEFNSVNDPDFLISRIAILLRVLQGQNSNIKCKKIFEELKDGNVIVELDDTPMPLTESTWLHDHNDADGNAIPISQLDSRVFDRGHKIAKSKGGSNTDVVLQKKRDNRQWQDDYEHNQ